MVKKTKKFLSSLLLSSIFLTLPFTAVAEENISNYLLEPMPSWYSERFTRGHLDIAKMIKDGYTRAEAVEIQNQMKDLLEKNSEYLKLEEEGNSQNLFKYKSQIVVDTLKQAIKNVKENKYFESGFKQETLKPNEFYVAFDLDETLLVQWYEYAEKGQGYYDIKTDTDDNILRPTLLSPKYVSLTPNFEKTLLEISKIPNNKGIIFFSAKLDTATIDIVNKMKIGGKPAKEFLKGLYTRNYLVRESEPTKLSKDLRIIDESLKHVIIIDDNPTRILEKQKKNLREIPKYNPDEYLKAKKETKNKMISDYYEKLLPIITEEIKESAQYATKNKVSFADAYYPYTMDASAELIMLMKQGYSYKQSLEILRTKKDLFEPKFYFYEDKEH